MSYAHHYSVWQDGLRVAAVDSGSADDALRGAMHYAAIYEQDGPVEVRYRGKVIYKTAQPETTHDH